jgi:hypothetical protein
MTRLAQPTSALVPPSLEPVPRCHCGGGGGGSPALELEEDVGLRVVEQ